MHRNEIATLQHSGASPEAIVDADFRCNQHRGKYEQLKADVKVVVFLFELFLDLIPEQKSRSLEMHLMLVDIELKKSAFLYLKAKCSYLSLSLILPFDNEITV